MDRVRMIFTGSKKTLEKKVLKLGPSRRGSHAQDSRENFLLRGKLSTVQGLEENNSVLSTKAKIWGQIIDYS